MKLALENKKTILIFMCNPLLIIPLVQTNQFKVIANLVVIVVETIATVIVNQISGLIKRNRIDNSIKQIINPT